MTDAERELLMLIAEMLLELYREKNNEEAAACRLQSAVAEAGG